jgi:hypothetical protein
MCEVPRWLALEGTVASGSRGTVSKWALRVPKGARVCAIHSHTLPHTHTLAPVGALSAQIPTGTNARCLQRFGTRALSRSLAHTLSLAHPPSRTHPLSHTHPVSLTPSLSHTPCLSPSLSHTPVSLSHIPCLATTLALLPPAPHPASPGSNAQSISSIRPWA